MEERSELDCVPQDLVQEEALILEVAESPEEQTKESEQNPLQEETDGPTFLCPICYDDQPESVCFELECGHKYCRKCLQEYVFAFAHDGKALDLRCPDPECQAENWGSTVVREIFSVLACTLTTPAGQMLSCEEVVARFIRFKMISEAQAHRGMIPCRKPGCDGLLIREDVRLIGKEETEDEVTSVEMAVACRLCETEHCGTCFYPHQSGETCKAAKSRVSKEEYKLTDKYKRRKEFRIAAKAFLPTVCTRVRLAVKPNVKRCPGCKKYIQKHFGCKHMYCTSCRTHFCWICTTKSGETHCRFAKAVWPLSLVLAIAFSAAYAPVMFLPWLAWYGVERGLEVPKSERRHITIWEQFYFVNEWLAAFPY